MTPRTLSSTAIGAALALATVSVALTASPTGAVGRPSSAHARSGDRALARLVADSRGAVRVSRGPDGVARIVGVTRAHDPLVTRWTSVRDAARAHLSRYGALVGVGDRGTRLVAGPVGRTVTGDTVVRFTQVRDGLPVIGGAVAVDLRPDRQLDSLTASVSGASVPAATYPADAAQQEALAVAAKRLAAQGRHLRLQADPPERRLFDPAVLGVRRTADPATHARGVWWVEVRAGAAFHRLVLVDDRTGGVVQDLDLDETLNRVVCDNHNFMDQPDVPCTSGFARTEHGPASHVRDVNDAFTMAGVVSRFYRQIGHLDLTRLIGVDEGNHRSLSSTVRYCDPFQPASACPLQNAFWNGVGMFYGKGYASADDVVGHEMTHGVIQHNADLFYWGQSGAINESLADVMGEIIDHRHPSRHDSPTSWTIGEDLPHGAIRSMSHPGRFRQPDSMTSKRYAPAGDVDNGGVHTNSGVGNRAFYLISQGGRQDGRRIRGIDGKSLRTSATLYLDVIQHLVSGSDYADLAAVLEHSCARLARHHTAGMTRADCRSIHRATVVTRMRTTPPHAKQQPDAPLACPRGTGPVRTLFDSERRHPRSEFDAGPTWVRAPNARIFPPAAANATSGHRSWYSVEPQDVTLSPLTMHPVALPVGRPVFLWFQQWRFLDSLTRFDGKHLNYDAGLVDVADATRGRGPQPAEHRPWVNGPHDRIDDEFDNPSPGRLGFSRDSRGYVASRLNLRHYAGHVVSPQFVMSTDNNSTDQGWYLDDIRVYTCGHGPVPRVAPQITGTPTVGDVLTADAGRWSGPDVTTEIRWFADGERIAGAGGTSYTLQAGDAGARITVKVTATAHGRHTAAFSAATDRVTT